MKRVLICEFYHETNTFNPALLNLDGFRAIRYAEGQEMLDACRALPTCSVHGMIDAVERAGGQVIPSISLFGCSGGKIEDAAYDYFRERLLYYLEEHKGSYDAVLCSLHGATCTESCGDICGEILSLIRRTVGEEMVVSACYDMHANITEANLRNADVICGYQTYPHIDLYETGYRAGALAMRKLAGEPLYQAAVLLPVLFSPLGYSTQSEPFNSIFDTGYRAVNRGEIVDFSVFSVQPWLDIPQICSSVVVLASDAVAAKKWADELAGRFFSMRDQLWPELMEVDDILAMAADPQVPKPVILADAADSPNAGAVGDSVFPAQRHQALGSAVSMCLFAKDEEAVEKAFALGVGNQGEFTIGNKYTPGLGEPFRGVGTVRSLHDGQFMMEGQASRGTRVNIGLSAVITIGNIDFLVCQAPIESGDPQILRHFGIEPSFYDLVVVKANASFRVPYASIAGCICNANTPGAGSADLKSFPWQYMPKGRYPFDLPQDYRLAGANFFR